MPTLWMVIGYRAILGFICWLFAVTFGTVKGPGLFPRYNFTDILNVTAQYTSSLPFSTRCTCLVIKKIFVDEILMKCYTQNSGDC